MHYSFFISIPNVFRLHYRCAGPKNDCIGQNVYVISPNVAENTV